MDIWWKIIIALAFAMMLPFMWRSYKYWSENSPKAEKGDWANVVFILGLVTLFISLLIISVQ